jgi:hypothetical protein
VSQNAAGQVYQVADTFVRFIFGGGAEVDLGGKNESEARFARYISGEWPKGAEEPIKYWLSTLPQDITFERLVDLAKLRWRIERDYQELKQEFGLGHYEGRGWRGFHHHATLCIAAYGFLISERGTIPPSGPRAAADLVPPRGSRSLNFPPVTDPEAPPIRPERHIPNSIATLRRRLTVALARHLSRCPCCVQKIARSTRLLL